MSRPSIRRASPARSRCSPLELFQAFYPGALPPGRLPLYATTLRRGNDSSHWCLDLRQADRLCADFRAYRQVCFGPAFQDLGRALAIARRRRTRASEASIRGCEAAISALPALWVEIPYGSGGSALLPPDRRHALDLLTAWSRRPSIAISTPHACYAFWLLDRPWLFDLDHPAADLAAAKALMGRLRWAFRLRAREHGWRLGAGGDLAAAFPVPGSAVGASAKGPRAELEAFPLIAGDGRYRRRDFASLPEPPAAAPSPLDGLLEPPPELTPRGTSRDLRPIVAGCAWARHCLADRSRLSRRELAAATALLSRCQAPGADGRRLVHHLWGDHPGYDPGLADRALAAALRSPDPITCRRIARARSVVDRYCARCDHFGRVETPLDLAPEAGANIVAEPRPSTHRPTAPGRRPGESTAVTGEALLEALEPILAALGGAATARRITAAFEAEPARFPELAGAFTRLFPDLPAGDVPAPAVLGYRLRALKGRVLGDRALIDTGRTRHGVAWAVHRVPELPSTPTLHERRNNPCHDHRRPMDREGSDRRRAEGHRPPEQAPVRL